MTDHDALVRAICAHPDDDTPRLVYADFLEESGEPDRAAFVRAQVDLARTPAWEPFAVLCRHRRREWSEEGAPFRHTLPAFPPGCGVAWHDRPFRRGLGWRVNVNAPRVWAALAPRLYEQAPVGELHLNTSATTLDDLRRFAAGEWVRHLRVVHLAGASPVEPIRVLCDSPFATGITDVHFHRASGAGMPELVEDLLRSPLGRGLTGLHFRVGYESVEYLIDALAGGETARLERLSFDTMGFTPGLVGRLLRAPALRHVTELDIRNDRFRDDRTGTVGFFLDSIPPGLRTLRLAGTALDRAGFAAIARSDRAGSLVGLDLSRNRATAGAVRALTESAGLAGLRRLDLRGCGLLGTPSLRRLTRATFWPNLVGLDLRNNPITDTGAGHLLGAPVPPDLTALLLDGDRIGPDLRAALREHYGDRLVTS